MRMCVLQYICIRSVYVAKCSVLLAMFANIRTYVHNIIIIGNSTSQKFEVMRCIKMPFGFVTLSFLTDEDPGPEGIFIHMNWVETSESSDLDIVL